MRISAGDFGAGSCRGMNSGAGFGDGAFDTAVTVELRCSASLTQRRSMLALRPLASAMAALETPGCWQASTSCALNSALCLRLRRRPATFNTEVSTCPRRSYVDTRLLRRRAQIKMTWPDAYMSSRSSSGYGASTKRATAGWRRAPRGPSWSLHWPTSSWSIGTLVAWVRPHEV